jgi:hypothetical protein
MDFEQHLAEMTQWYCERVKEPAWREYVEHRMQELSRNPMYAPVVQAVRQAWAQSRPS